MDRLHGTPRHYSWGSRTAIQALVGQGSDDRPTAELWLGAHPSSPATVQAGAGPRPLTDVIAASPEHTMGWDVVARFGPSLPYLLKVIAADGPLSLQVHPDCDQAQAGFAAEEALGIPRDDPRRNYKDANHKPELVYALTRFEALCGFRAPRRAAQVLAGLEAPLARTLHGVLTAQPSSAGIRSAFQWLLQPDTRPDEAEVDAVVAACRGRLSDGSPSPRADRTVVQLAEAYPGDPGAVTSLLLNPVTLRPGEAMFVPAGGVHAYLSGMAVEVMASSDNVLRAGLTSKHVDIPELLRTVDYVAAPPIRIAPEVFYGATRAFYAPVDDFELSVTTVEDDATHTLPGQGPRVLLATDGSVTVAARTASSGRPSLTLTRGQAAFVPAADGPLTVRGRGTVVQADVP